MKGLRKNAMVRVAAETRAPGLKKGAEGTIVRTWPRGHKYSGKYFVVRFGQGEKAKTRVLARKVIEPTVKPTAKSTAKSTVEPTAEAAAS